MEVAAPLFAGVTRAKARNIRALPSVRNRFIFSVRSACRKDRAEEHENRAQRRGPKRIINQRMGQKKKYNKGCRALKKQLGMMPVDLPPEPHIMRPGKKPREKRRKKDQPKYAGFKKHLGEIIVGSVYETRKNVALLLDNAIDRNERSEPGAEWQRPKRSPNRCPGKRHAQVFERVRLEAEIVSAKAKLGSKDCEKDRENGHAAHCQAIANRTIVAALCGRRTMTMTPTKAIHGQGVPALERAMASPAMTETKKTAAVVATNMERDVKAPTLSVSRTAVAYQAAARAERHIEVSSEMIPIG